MIIIGQVSERESIEAHFEISFDKETEVLKQYRIDKQGECFVITCQKPHIFSIQSYGMVPFWSKERILHFEGPIDGGGEPPDETSTIKKRIILQPSYRRPIRESRCLIPTDYFIVKSTTDEYYLLFSSTNRPFALAGVYDNWKQSYHEKDLYTGFCVLTTPSTGKIKEMGIERLPLIINTNRYKLWLKKEAALTEITKLLNPIAENELNGYQVNRKMIIDGFKEREIVRPSSDLIYQWENIDNGKLAQYLKSFRYKRGVTHKTGQEERIWRGNVN